ncbi:hypothetical protein [Alicyclobacillus sp. SO9]|uniref:hypothetical protein n=1 Tax=Alicyclobacillus sp. SO9 TaxID=2665646 RepID=UPI0018E776A3|nr:hypothetical protein [Alicyclobacillus sp. SO9]QQE78301.1 hypothetical protein GI364_20860 [Alicyclobacillus sp. SO9]
MELLHQISPGVVVNVWFDGGPASGRRGVYLGTRGSVASFLINQTGGPQVVFVPYNQLQAVSLSAVG